MKFAISEIDPCSVDNGGCDQLCYRSTGASVRCDCLPGYILKEDRRTCKEYDPCAHKNGGCDHICHPHEGISVCSCRENYVLEPDGTSCTSKLSADEIIAACN
ncbi:uncharacterized protein CEXT_753041 [Caerostris extrusa]|uniref:EGF-like domain-containing protein n=1 Tax=Caerostris extrusa TaxID=172846 RepID=A0AAV4RWI7_CAEEX|nr:uncharacterized protein CEXT_753041 [Caerostris extrusa]